MLFVAIAMEAEAGINPLSTDEDMASTNASLSRQIDALKKLKNYSQLLQREAAASPLLPS